TICKDETAAPCQAPRPQHGRGSPGNPARRCQARGFRPKSQRSRDPHRCPFPWNRAQGRGRNPRIARFYHQTSGFRGMIILDTNVFSALMREVPDQAVLAWMDQQPDSSLWTTTVTLMELQ